MWLHLHRADLLFPWWEGLTRELLSAPGHTEHPKRLPCSGFSISSSHTGPLPGKAMGGKLCQQVMAAQRSSNLRHPGISSLLRELAAISQEGSYEDGLWFIFGCGGAPFQKLRNPQTLGCYLDNLVLIPSPCKPFQAVFSARMGSRVSRVPALPGRLPAE